MDKITTPMAVLISGILIFIGLVMNYNNSKWFITTEKLRDETGKRTYIVKTNIHTGYSCEKRLSGQEDWFCSDTVLSEYEKNNKGKY